jgi:hypothetical protein
MRSLKPALISDVEDVRKALDCLRRARDLLKRANAKQSAKRVRLAITSAAGALRHVNRRREYARKIERTRAIAASASQGATP